MYYYALGITFLLAFISFFTNIIIDSSRLLNLLTLLTAPFLFFLYWLSYYKRKVRLSQNIFLFYVFFLFNIIWLTTQGSAGGGLVIIQAFILILIFFSSQMQVIKVLPLLFVNVFFLFIIEWTYPEYIESYSSNQARSLDVFVNMSIFFLFEIPVILFAKRIIDEDRIKAIKSEERKTSYIVNMSHEIRTPMNAIMGFAELLDDDDLDNDSKKQFIQIINDNSRTLLNLLNNIINLSKIEQDQTNVSLSKFNVSELLKQVNDVIKLQARKKKNIDLGLVIPNNDIFIESDAIMLYQIIINLGYNAIKFTDNGFIHLGCFVVDNNVVVYVKDTGKGMSKESAGKLFEKFSQVDSSNVVNNPNGAGLGLAICKQLTRLLKGEIWVDTTLNVGTTFYVKLPIKFNNKH